MANLVLSNLTKRKTRSLVSIIAVALEITLVLILVGISNGTLNDVADRLKNVGADLIVLPPGSSPILTLNSVSVPIKFAEKLSSFDNVKAVSPVLTWTTKKIGGQIMLIFGIEPESFMSMGGTMSFLQGRPLRDGLELVIDKRLADAHGFEVGSNLNLMNEEFTIVGICKAGIGARLFMPITTLQALVGQPDKASVFFMKCDTNQNIQRVADQIESSFTGFQTHILSAYSDILAKSAVGLNEFISVVTFTALIASFLVILLAMYTTIVERTKQIGILKSLGASNTFIIKSIMWESIILCMAGVISGYIMTYTISRWLSYSHPLLIIQITITWLLIAGILGICGGVLGSLYPAYRAVRQDPVKALMYE